MPGRPTIWITVGQGPTALAVGTGMDCLDIFTLLYPFSSLSPSLWETARYRLKYCLKGPLNAKQPTNQHRFHTAFLDGVFLSKECLLGGKYLLVKGQILSSRGDPIANGGPVSFPSVFSPFRREKKIKVKMAELRK